MKEMNRDEKIKKNKDLLELFSGRTIPNRHAVAVTTVHV